MTVLQTLIKPGTHVKKGDVVAEFDRQYMLLRLDDYKASLEQVENSMRILKANLEVDKKAHEQSISDARAALDKTRLDLKTIPVRGEIDSEKLRLNEQEAAAYHKQLLTEVKYKDQSQAASWRNAELEMRESKVELQRAEVNAERMIYKAPIEGITVMSTIFRSGEMSTVQQGDMLMPGQLFMQIVDLTSMVVNARANQADVERLRLGQRAKVHFDAYPELELPAHVYSIGAMPKTGGFRADYVKEVAVSIKLDKLDPRLIPDLSVSVDVIVDREDQGVIAPREAVFTDGGDGKPFVFVRSGNAWERREVELGLVNHVAALVRTGLKPGEMVAAERPPEQKRT